MNKSSFVSAVLIAVTFLSFSSAQAQKFPALDKSPADIAMYPTDFREPVKVVKVIYSRPQLNGRTLNELAPNGKVWRTGANEANEITFYKDVTLDGKKVKAGSYSLYTIPDTNSYTVILNKELNSWGAYSYKEDQDVARIKVPVTTSDESLEALGMVFTKSDKGYTLNIGWGKTRIAVPFVE